jgi:hypothetical protein
MICSKMCVILGMDKINDYFFLVAIWFLILIWPTFEFQRHPTHAMLMLWPTSENDFLGQNKFLIFNKKNQKKRKSWTEMNLAQMRVNAIWEKNEFLNFLLRHLVN